MLHTELGDIYIASGISMVSGQLVEKLLCVCDGKEDAPVITCR